MVKQAVWRIDEGDSIAEATGATHRSAHASAHVSRSTVPALQQAISIAHMYIFAGTWG